MDESLNSKDSPQRSQVSPKVSVVKVGLNYSCEFLQVGVPGIGSKFPTNYLKCQNRQEFRTNPWGKGLNS